MLRLTYELASGQSCFVFGSLASAGTMIVPALTAHHTRASPGKSQTIRMLELGAKSLKVDRLTVHHIPVGAALSNSLSLLCSALKLCQVPARCTGWLDRRVSAGQLKKGSAGAPSFCSTSSIEVGSGFPSFFNCAILAVMCCIHLYFAMQSSTCTTIQRHCITSQQQYVICTEGVEPACTSPALQCTPLVQQFSGVQLAQTKPSPASPLASWLCVTHKLFTVRTLTDFMQRKASQCRA